MFMVKHHANLFLILVLSLTFGAVGSANADQLPYHYGQIIVENVWVTPGRKGSQSILRLRIINDGTDHEHLLRVETSIAEDSRIVGRISDHRTTTFDSFSIRADSELDLTDSEMWIELGPLVRDVRPGESIPVNLVFVKGRIHAEAHVHSADG